ncbi:unannotated protein [freshwater metagenome]|uniref:Unannotated protein n=1 Tax=freshwater metagenome TaxID=449393 RepID=A0A6J6EQP1_9ZZZZ
MTYGEMGRVPPNANSVPPTIAMSANSTLRIGTTICDEESLSAAAAGVTRSASTSSAPTICTAAATASPSSMMKMMPSSLAFTPLATATSGSSEAKLSGLQITSKTEITISEMMVIAPSFGSSTATICPVRSPNLLAALPGYKASARIPIPKPNGIKTATIEFLSLALSPSKAMISAARNEPKTEPKTTSKPISRKTAAPANESSEIPCTAKDSSRCITKTPTNPPITASSAPANSELKTKGISWS